ncbi:MAG: PIN domain nuclease [Dehalococcoidia bacterium]|nr:PIN domain nuclease [Dehalococcoidia bacterium]
MAGLYILRCLGAILFGLGGWRLGLFINAKNPPMEGTLWIVLLIVCGVAVGFGFVYFFQKWMPGKIKHVPAQTLFAATVGLVIALILSAILTLPLSQLPEPWSWVSPAVACLVLSYLGISLMVMRGRDVGSLVGLVPSVATGRTHGRGGKFILDTNSIIDGRIADIIQTGFVYGTMIIPKFVLDELHYIADSPDPLRRTRGRRGLDILTKLQKDAEVPVQISDIDFEGVREVDTKLVELAKVMRCPIVTNDVNLNRVASLQGVRILNINELVNALKPVVLPGEEMRLRIVQEGKEHGQGIGFLDDGTMVVVEGGRRYINNEITVIVSRVLQTGAGRMIFAQPRN